MFLYAIIISIEDPKLRDDLVSSSINGETLEQYRNRMIQLKKPEVLTKASKIAMYKTAKKMFKDIVKAIEDEEYVNDDPDGEKETVENSGNEDLYKRYQMGEIIDKGIDSLQTKISGRKSKSDSDRKILKLDIKGDGNISPISMFIAGLGFNVDILQYPRIMANVIDMHKNVLKTEFNHEDIDHAFYWVLSYLMKTRLK